MMPQLTLIGVAAAVLITAVAAVYLFSADSTRRTRAWRLLTLILRRRTR